jgi:hypothetical protein
LPRCRNPRLSKRNPATVRILPTAQAVRSDPQTRLSPFHPSVCNRYSGGRSSESSREWHGRDDLGWWWYLAWKECSAFLCCLRQRASAPAYPAAWDTSRVFAIYTRVANVVHHHHGFRRVIHLWIMNRAECFPHLKIDGVGFRGFGTAAADHLCKF